MRHAIPAVLLSCLALAAACDDGDPTGPATAGTATEAGGVIASPDGGARLHFPPGAVHQATPITAQRLAAPPAAPGLVAGTAYEFGPSGLQFDAPVRLEIGLGADALPEGVPLATAVLHRRTGSGWTRVPGSRVDPGTRAVQAELQSFSVYAVIFLGAPDQVVLGGETQTAASGAAVPVAPSVVVRSERGEALSGLRVTFTVASGGGAVTGGVQTTDDQGRAAVESWTLGPVPGPNTLHATVEGLAAPVVFTAEATAGPPAAIVFVAGADTTTYPGEPHPVSPAVRVTDAAGFPVAGVTVAFSADRGGLVSAPTATTDADGVATLGTWTLGDHGENRLQASAGGAPAAILTVTTLNPCGHLRPMTLGQAVSGTLTRGRDCVSPPGRLTQYWGVTLAQGGAFNVALSSPDFGPFVGSFEGGARQVAGRSAGSGTVAAEHVVPAGTYRLFATTQQTDADTPPQGSYTLSATAVAEPQAGCMPATFVTDGSVAAGRLTAADCEDPYHGEAGVIRYVDDYALLLYAGETATVTVSAGFPIRFTRWTGGAYQEGIFGIPANQPRTMTVTATATAFHSFAVISEHHQGTGDYTVGFSIQGGAAGAGGQVTPAGRLEQALRREP
jgi:hypothetical protein